MGKARLEAFSDGVLAIIITIMVLELKVPHGAQWENLAALLPVLMGYALSFVFVGIYWNNHHHMLHAAHRISASNLWANLHLLFWLSLVPFVTGWMGENHFAQLPVALYGFVLLMSGAAYFILGRTLVAGHGKDSTLAIAMGKDRKGMLSLVLYLCAIPLAFVRPWMAMTLYVAVALIWLVPDRRIEKAMASAPHA
jgi:uncharacterized membrane protein